MSIEEIRCKLDGIEPSTMTADSLTQEEWAELSEHHHELSMEAYNLRNEKAMLQSVQRWIDMTVLLPAGLLSAEEVVELVGKVLGRMQEHE